MSVFVVDSPESAAELLAILEANPGPFGVDCETVECNPREQSPVHTARIVCFSVAWFEATASSHPSCPTTKVSNRAFIWGEYLEHFRLWLQSDKHKVGASFTSYDMHAFENHGIRVGGVVHDNKHASRMWYSSKDIKHDLKSQAASVLGYRTDSYAGLFSRAVANKPKTYKADRYYPNGNCRTGPLVGVPTLVVAGEQATFSQKERELIPLDRVREDYPDRVPELIEYASNDAKWSLELMPFREKQLASRPAKYGSTLDLYKSVWHPGLLMLNRMERTGMCLDKDVCADIESRTNADMAALLPGIHAFAGSAEFNPGSWQQLQGLLRDKLGLRRPEVKGTVWAMSRPKEDEYSTSEAALAWLQVKYPEHSQGIGGLRRWKKIRRQMQFSRDLPTFVSSVDSRLHTVLGPEADTGRLSAKLPALQQIPSKNDQYGLRGAFVAAPGNSLVVADYAQLEVYVLAHMLSKLFQDYSLRDALAGDVYTWIARKVWARESLAWTDADFKNKSHPAGKKRDLAKILVLATNYGKTSTGLAMSLIDLELDGEPADETFCSALLDTYLGVLPGIPRWQEWIGAYARKCGGVPTLLGRWRPIPMARSDRRGEAARGYRQALNTPIQGGAADIVTCAMLGLNNYDGIPGYYNEALGGLGAECIMQIHDELIFEVPHYNAEAAQKLIEAGMVNPPVVDLAVKLKVEANYGASWKAAK